MNKLLVGIGVGAVAVGAAALLWARVGGGTDAIEAVPADAQAVAFFDVVEIYQEFTSDRVAGFLGEIDPQLAAIDAALDDRIGMTIADDVLPWVGTTAAVWAMGDDDQGMGCLVISARDRAAADRFVTSLLAIDGLPESESRGVEGGTVHDFDQEDGETVTIGRVEGVVLMCGGEGAADASVAALLGESKADDAELAALIDRDALVVGWIDLPTVAATAGEMDDTAISIDQAELAPAVAVFDITDRGFEWSLETASTFGAEMADDSLAVSLPAGTVLALFGGTPDIDLASMAGDVEGQDQDLLGLAALLDGPLAIGVAGDPASLLAQMFDAPLNLVLSVSSSDPSALADEIIGLVGSSFGMTGDAFTEETYAGGTLYTLSFPFIGDLASMAVTADYVAISASAEAAKGEGPRLTDSDAWAEAKSALGGDLAVGFFFDAEGFRELDLAALLEMAEGSLEDSVDVPEDAPSAQDLLAIEQVRMIVAGSGTDGTTLTAKFLVLLDW